MSLRCAGSPASLSLRPEPPAFNIRARYTAFGADRYAPGTIPTSYRYTGQRLDADTWGGRVANPLASITLASAPELKPPGYWMTARERAFFAR